jgi:hypothetical protein
MKTPTPKSTMNCSIYLAALSALSLGSARAAVVLADMGLTTPTGHNTGYTGTTDQRFSLDGPELPATPAVTDSYGQSFTVGSSGTLQYLYLAYNAGGLGSFKISIDANFTGNQSSSAEILTDAASAGTQYTINIADTLPGGLSGQTTAPADGNAGPFYWFRLDFTGENISLTANQTAAFFIQGFSETTGDDSTFIYAPRYSTTQVYSGGVAVAGTTFSPLPVTSGTADMGFAVTVVPEPSSALLGGLAMLRLLRRRR